jgi:hypothetical protein
MQSCARGALAMIVTKASNVDLFTVHAHACGLRTHDCRLTACMQAVEVRCIDPKICGGGRGLFATRAITVGTVLDVEEPFLLVPDEREARETLHTALVSALVIANKATTM